MFFPSPHAWFLLGSPLFAPATTPVAGIPTPFALDLVAYLSTKFPEAGVYPGRIPETGAVYPAIVYNLVGGSNPRRLSGSSGVAIDRWQLDCYSPDAGECYVLAEGLRMALFGVRFRIGSTLVMSSGPDQRTTGDDPSPDSDDDGLFRSMNTYTITRSEPIPRPGV